MKYFVAIIVSGAFCTATWQFFRGVAYRDLSGIYIGIFILLAVFVGGVWAAVFVLNRWGRRDANDALWRQFTAQRLNRLESNHRG